MKDFYYILGTDINCTSTEIREAYNKLSKKFHPDLNQNDYYFESRFKEISEAYETLIDPVKRSKYDDAVLKTKLYPSVNKHKTQPYYLKTKRVDRIFSIMLALITLVFGYYVYRSIYGSKTHPINKAVAYVHPVKRHKKKHPVKIKPTRPITHKVVKAPNLPAKVIADTIRPHPLPAAPAVVNVKYVSKPPVSNVANKNAAFLYTAFIKANVTGVVYMRKFDNYNADIVSAIPANSKVSVLQKGKIFYKVLFNTQTGYVPKWTVAAD